MRRPRPDRLRGPSPQPLPAIALVESYALGPVREAGVVFVHVPKTGGTSVARALYGTDGPGHRTIAELRDELGDAFVDRALSFAVVRGPIDRLASAFRYLRRGGSNPLDAAFGRDVLSAFDTLEAFVLDWLTPETAQTQVHFRPQADFVCDAGGAVGVDRLIPYERLAEGYAAVRRETGVGGPLPHLNRTPRAPVRLSPSATGRVAMVYASDVPLLDTARSC